jgi:hypothetical protein
LKKSWAFIQNKKSVLRIKKHCLKLLGRDKCHLCQKSNKQNLILHHREYFDDSVRHYQFESELDYQYALQDEVIKRPNNFLVLCNEPCHTLWEVVERGMKYFKYYGNVNDKIKRYLKSTNTIGEDFQIPTYSEVKSKGLDEFVDNIEPIKEKAQSIAEFLSDCDCDSCTTVTEIY